MLFAQETWTRLKLQFVSMRAATQFSSLFGFIYRNFILNLSYRNLWINKIRMSIRIERWDLRQRPRSKQFDNRVVFFALAYEQSAAGVFKIFELHLI